MCLARPLLPLPLSSVGRGGGGGGGGGPRKEFCGKRKRRVNPESGVIVLLGTTCTPMTFYFRDAGFLPPMGVILRVSLFQWLFDANIGYVCQRVCHPLDELLLEPPNGYVLRPLGEHLPAQRRLLYPHLAS